MLCYVHMGNGTTYEDMYGKGTTRNSVPVPGILRIAVQDVIVIRKRWNSTLK